MNRIQTMATFAALSAIVSASAACNPTSDEARSDGIAAEREALVEIRDNDHEAQKTIKAAEQEAAKQTAKAQTEAQQAEREAATKVAEAQQDNRAQNAAVQAKANATIREANSDQATAKAELHEWAQKQLDDLDNALDGARAKAQSTTPKTQQVFNVAMKRFEAKRDELAVEVASLHAQGARKSDEFKSHLGAEVTSLKKRIDKLSSSL